MQDSAVSLPDGKRSPLHRMIYDELSERIRRGDFRDGDRLPSESDLCKEFQASRITVAKAIHQLQRDGVVVRRAGSGSYIQMAVPADSYQFGLLIPELGRTEIFEPICQGIMSSPQAKSHSLIWGHTPAGETSRSEEALSLCRQFIQQRVGGVFFAPLEYSENRDQTNNQIVSELTRADIPVVLLDRCYLQYPMRSNLDRVGIDNYRASYIATRHLLNHGARRIVFVARRQSASTILERACGCLFALHEAGSEFPGATMYGDVADIDFVKHLMTTHSPDGIVCGNDLTAARLMKTLISMEIRVPAQVKIVSFDDVNYAKFLPVPLTTIHQDCAQIGEQAIAAMLRRVADRMHPGLDINVPFELVVRESCGADVSRN